MIAESSGIAHKTDLLWAVILGAVFVLLMSFAIAANSTSNSIATLVGSKTATMKQALLTNICFQLAACLYVSFSNGETELHYIIELASYDKHRTNLLLGQVAMISGLAVWLLFSTYKKMPVSPGHSVFAAAIAFSVVLDGFSTIRWHQIWYIMCSWIVSPILSGVVSLAIFAIIDYFVLRKKNDIELTYWSLPILFSFSAFINSFALIQATVRDFGLVKIPLYLSFATSLAVAGIIALLVIFFVGPMLNESIEYEEQKAKSLKRDAPTIRINRFKVKKVAGFERPLPFKVTIDGKTQIFNRIRKTGVRKFRYALTLLINKCFKIANREHQFPIEYQFGSVLVFSSGFALFLQAVQNFRHCAVPLTILLKVYKNERITGSASATPLLLCYILPAICLGSYLCGSRVTETLGTKLATLYPVNGFISQIGTITTVITAHQFGIPISFTHCLLGSIMCVGLVDERENSIDWKATKEVLIYSIFTLPATLCLVGLFSFILRFAL